MKRVAPCLLPAALILVGLLMAVPILSVVYLLAFTSHDVGGYGAAAPAVLGYAVLGMAGLAFVIAGVVGAADAAR